MEEKIRLAVFGQKRLSREGGIEIVVKELCTRMAQNGCDVTCYNRAGHHVSGAEYDKTIEYDGIRQKVVPTIEKKGLAAVSSSFFAALCSAFGRYDVVHIHAEGPAFFCWIPKLFGKRVISTIHGLDWAREKWKFSVGSKFIRQGEKNAVKYADEIIVLSKGVQKYFMDTYGRETHFIPNGVNRPEVREAKLITDHFGLEKDSYILFLGRLVPEKGIRYLVEAFKDVKTDKKLVIAGGSSDTDSFMEELKDLAKGDDRILFTGFVQGAMLDELYSNAYMHLRCYEKRADVNAVVHAHPPAATGFAVAHRPMDMYNMIEDVAAIGAVPLTPYGTPSTTEVPDAIEPYLNDHDVMLLENHGALTVGSDVITAYYRMESLELWAKITINAIILGGSYDIDRKNIDKLINLRSYYKITGKHPGYRKFERREKGEPTDK